LFPLLFKPAFSSAYETKSCDKISENKTNEAADEKPKCPRFEKAHFLLLPLI